MDNFLSTAYLFNVNPTGFQYRDSVLLISVIFILLFVGGTYLLKKRREFLKINKDQRFKLQYFVKWELALSALLFCEILGRVFAIAYISTRVLPILTLLAMLLVGIFAGLKAYQLREQRPLQEESADEYAKYLPKKKKK
jgi:hypothetical protein